MAGSIRPIDFRARYCYVTCTYGSSGARRGEHFCMAFRSITSLLKRSYHYTCRVRNFQPVLQSVVSSNMQQANGDRTGCSCDHKDDKHHENFTQLLQANRQWAAEMRATDPEFFVRLTNQQNPEYLWIGCSDSRVPANQILGLQPGEIFVQRNVGNQAMHTDMNLMACLEYAVKSLKVKTIILCGHYSCGAVKAALQLPHKTPGLVNCWISDIRECRNQAERELRNLDSEQQFARLCELNVLRQVFHVATSPVVAGAWAEGQELHLYGVIYDLADGHLRKLAGPISGDDEYQHSLEGFVTEEGLKVTRCPRTSMLRVSSTSTDDHDVFEASALVGSDGDLVYPLPLGTTPSEFVSGINNINLKESISRHKLWTHGGETTPSSDGSEQGARLVKRDSSRGSSMNGRAFHHAGSLSLNGHANLPTNYAAAASTGH